MSRPVLSVVAPCFNEEGGLPEFVRRTARACAEVAEADFEIVLINDGSRDRTWTCMKALSMVHPQIVAINLSRNHGHQLAATAGLMAATGERVLVIDADLQDPPELLAAMMARMNDGFDVIYGRRRARPSETRLKRWTAYLFYRGLGLMAEVDIPRDTGDFRLMSRRIVDRLNQMPEQDRFLRGMVAWLGGAQAELLYDREPRYAGRSGYTLLRMLKLASAGVTSFSTLPLRLASVAAVLGAAAAVGIGVYAIVGFISGQVIPGWTSLILTMVFFSTVQLACLGILGSYVGRTFLQVKGRPLFLVDEIVRGAGEAAARHTEPSLSDQALVRAER